MGRELYEALPGLRRGLRRGVRGADRISTARCTTCCRTRTALDRTEYTQPALFAVEVALFRLLARYGVGPDLLIGHSIGELAAAHVAGVSDPGRRRAAGRRARPADAGAARRRRHGRGPGRRGGGARRCCAEGVEIAAVNGPDSVVLSGDDGAVAGRRGALRAPAAGQPLRVSHAFHSAQMDPMLAEFAAVAASLTFRGPASRSSPP